MSELIASLLFATSRKLFTVDDLITYAKSYAFTESKNYSMTITLSKDLAKVSINLVQVARSLIDIIDNAVAVATHHD